LLILRGVDHANLGVDPEQLEVFHVRSGQPLEGRLEAQDLELEGLALGIDADPILDGPARFIEELAGLLQQLAVLA
jgi:hypothetical protein